MRAAVAVLVGASVLLLSLAVLRSTIRDVDARLVGGRENRRTWRTWLVRFGTSRVGKKIPRRALQRRAVLAGDASPIEFIVGLKLALALGAAGLVALSALVIPPLGMTSPLAAAAAFQLPDMMLAKSARARLARMSDQVPELADLLLIMAEAGLSPVVAFRRAAEVLPQPLGSELEAVIRRLELGVPWRSALADVADRTGLQPLKRLTRALTRSQRLGASLAPVLRKLADDLRRERRAEAETAARQAPVKMLFPLVFLILPAFLLLTVGPVVLSTIRSLQ